MPDSEVDLLKQRLLLTRLPTNLSDAQWTESSENQVSVAFLSSTLKFWTESYSWRDEEALLNKLPQFIVPIPVEGFGNQNVHFIHSPSSKIDSIPMLFLHGWPGSFNEISKALPLLNEAGFSIVAPSLPGWLSSTSPINKGYSYAQHSECWHKLMLKLGYDKYVVQGGDWGGNIGPVLAATYPNNVLALHLNTFAMLSSINRKYDPEGIPEDQKYTEFEQKTIANSRNWQDRETAYQKIQGTKPLTLGVGLHDSPIGMLAWMADKIFTWSDCYPQNQKGYKWTPTEFITWTLIHYFSDSGPTGPLRMYQQEGSTLGREAEYVTVPTGVSAFAAEVEMVPRSWAETKSNVVWWREHEIGGHFAMYERPEDMVEDFVDFVRTVGLRK